MDAPNHIGIILDGNRRYAKSLGLKSWKGHEYGAKRVEEVIKSAKKFGVKILTLYTFSTENIKRESVEVKFLFKLFKKAFFKFEKGLAKEDIKVLFAGNKNLFPKDIQKLMLSIEEKTKNCSSMKLYFAMGYGGRDEILNTVRDIIKTGRKVDEKSISDNLYVKEDVDMIIRTGGEFRISNFLPWQGVYAELIFLDKMWPQFTEDDLKSCIEEYNTRKRRFGQ